MTVGELRDRCKSIPDLRVKWDALVDSALPLHAQEARRGAKLQSTGNSVGDDIDATRLAYAHAYAALNVAVRQAGFEMPEFELYQICELYR
ncbi:MAG: hypothetical protein M3Q63_01890 [bacterium]|nr:hypothetical protein [bacterium]